VTTLNTRLICPLELGFKWIPHFRSLS
jgi:hypothetical protein